MAKKPIKTKRPDATIDAMGKTFTLLMGTAALLQLEKAFDAPLAEMRDKLERPGLETVRDMLAACLIANHSQAADGGTGGALKGLYEKMGMEEPIQPCNWPMQQALANSIMDAVGLDAATEAIGRAVETSPYFSSQEAPATP